MKSLQVITLGCSKNDIDTEHILAQAKGHYDIKPDTWTGPVDVIMLNTCGFIGDAKEQSIEAILAQVVRKQNGEVGRIIVFGCLSQRYADELPKEIPEVDDWFGARETDPIVKALGIEPSRKLDTERYFANGLKGTAYLKISEGCDRRCSYCAIPYIRGGHKSVPIEILVEETRKLAARGVKELVLIAQDTTYYGLDIYRKRALADLLKELSKVDGIEWMRIHYSYPDGFPDDVLEQMAVNPKVCKYLDIPLQHISDKVLSMMRRNVDGAWTRDLIRRLRERVPGVVLRTTMIVGHPGEGVKEFNELMKFVEDAHFERLGAFKYSEEDGTYGALNYRDSVLPKTKQSRYDRLMTLQGEMALEFNQSRVGSIEKVMVDDFTDDVFVCRSQYESPEVDGEILVKYEDGAFGGKTPESLIGEFINVKIIGADQYDLIAEPVE